MPPSSGLRRIGIGTADIRDSDIERVERTLRAGRLSAGPMMEEFEARFASLHGRTYASMCNSGTGALQLALQALKEKHGWPRGAEVIVPAMTFVATVNTVLFNGLRPVLVDIDPATFTIDPNLVTEAISPRTVAVIPVHLFGQPADMTRVMEVASHAGVRVIEDSAEAVGVRHRGRVVGSFGEFACFSTYMAHLVTTGVGGIAITDDPDNATRFRSLMNHGRNPRYLRIDDDQGRSDRELIEIVWSRYEFHSLGQSFRATEMEAALGIGQLDRLQETLDSRRRVAGWLNSALEDDRIRLPIVGDGNEHAYMMYPIVCSDADLRDRMVVALERAGVETRFLLPILGQRCYDDVFDYTPGAFPHTEGALACGFYIGCHQHMTQDDIAYIADVVRGVLRGRAA